MTSDLGPPSGWRRGQGLALIGYRATGKSTVGRILAKRLDRPFLDADLEIEAQAGESIREIFAHRGEPVFRDWEEQVLARLTAANPKGIVATGGGAVLREANRRRLRSFGLVVWLTALPSELARRLVSDGRGLADRPALTTAGTVAEIAEVLQARAPLYELTADAVIDTAGRSPDQVADDLIICWRQFVLGPAV
jgi:shikimate kinase